MKKLNLFTLFLFLSILIAFGNSTPETNTKNQDSKKSTSGIKRYGVKKACIEYEISGSQIGTEILYFEEWGMREAKYTKTELKIAGITQKTNTATFLDGSWIYTIDLDKNTGTKMENPMLKQLEGKDLTEVGEQMMKSMGGKKIGSELFLGKMCDIWEIKNLGTKAWIWKGITLKTKTNMMGMKMSNTAIKIQDDFPKKKLEIPAGVNFSEREDPLKMLQKMKNRYQQN